MNFFSRLSLKSKLVYMLLGVAMGCIIVVGYQGLTHGKQEITKKVYDQLTSVRSTKTSELQHYFNQVRAELKSLAENHTTVGAMREFESAFKRFKNETINDSMMESLETYYQTQFFPDLKKNIDGEPDLEFYVPHTPAGRYLQYHYLTNNPNPKGEKQRLEKANDQSYYSGVHSHYHSVFKNQIENSGYYDLFLISLKTGDIVYSVFKETDFATNLTQGPYSNSNLAQLYRKVKSSQDKGAVLIQDFEFYRPSYNQPAGFLGTVIYDGNNPIGVLAIQIPLGNSLIATDADMGSTGEVVIVGNDLRMRSNARSLNETVDCYRAYMPNAANNAITQRICQNFSSILLESIDNAAVRQALAGKEGTAIVRSYYGEKVLASYGPIGINGLNWVMTAQMEVDEANQPVYAFQRDLTLATVLLGCIVTLLALWLSNIFIRPVTRLMDGVAQLRDGDLDVQIELDRKDEFGQLANTFNQTVQLLREKDQTIQDKASENEMLMRNILPDTVVRRLQHGDQQIADRIDNVSVLFTSIQGFTSLAETLSPEESVKSLNTLINAFDNAAERHGVEKVKTIGDNYMACCGLTVPRLDHAKRILAFAKEIRSIVDAYNVEHHTSLATRTGIHSGPVTAGIIGKTRFVYDLWGESVNVASRIRYEASSNAILVTDSIFNRLSDGENFTLLTELATPSYGVINVWQWNESSAADDDETLANATDDTQILEAPFLEGVAIDE